MTRAHDDGTAQANMSQKVTEKGDASAQSSAAAHLKAETSFPLGVSGLETGVTPHVLDSSDKPAEHNLNGYPDLDTLLCIGEGLYNKWHAVDRFETKEQRYKQFPEDTYPNNSCPTRICSSCGKTCVLQQYTRSHEPYGRIETNHAFCNSCKFQKQGIRLTREDFHRKYLGFEGAWPYSEGLWAPSYV